MHNTFMLFMAGKKGTNRTLLIKHEIFLGTWEYEFLFAPPYDVGIDIGKPSKDIIFN